MTDSIEHDEVEWNRYFKTTTDTPMHPFLDEVIPHLPHQGHILDLGCGTGRATVRLVEHGLQVTAVDRSQVALDIVKSKLPEGSQVELIRSSFEDLKLGSYDFVLASFTLFFLTPDGHAEFWPRLVGAIKPGGLFAGQFLGVRDTWDARGYATHADPKPLLEGFDILHFEEEEKDGKTATGEEKHWHLFHVIARKD